jgi:hypothetical protein
MPRFKRAKGKRSGFESRVCADLDKRGVKYEYEKETFTYIRPVRAAHCRACGGRDVGRVARYTPDLKVRGEFIELKGRLTSANRTQLVEFVANRADVKLRLLFMRDNYTTAKKRIRYSEWAKSKGFECAVGEKVPDAWLQ